MKVLVIQQKMIGDVLTTSILFEAIRLKYPKAELHYLINAATRPVVEHHPFIDDYIILTTDIENSKVRFLKFITTVKKEKFDVIIDVYSKLSSNIISLFSGAKTKISYHKPFRTFIYTNTIEREKHTDSAIGLEITNRLRLLQPLGITVKSLKPKIYLTQKELNKSLTYLKENNLNLGSPIFMISVLGSSKEKTYPLPYMATIINTIVEETNAQILFNYIPQQKDEARKAYDFCTPKTQSNIQFEVFGKNLREFLAITKQCTALIGNEGGAINMAKALDIPTFSIFAPWIDKTGWNMFEDDDLYTSVHLKDLKPELFGDAILKTLKKESKAFYDAFLPDYIIPKLKAYLTNFK
ncbi:glycosyltransferase family 9 protein [Flavobacteriaceae bacterium MHTCC 0001]